MTDTPFRVVVYPEHGVLVAQALEFALAARDPSLTVVLEELGHILDNRRGWTNIRWPPPACDHYVALYEAGLDLGEFNLGEHACCRVHIVPAFPKVLGKITFPAQGRCSLLSKSSRDRTLREVGDGFGQSEDEALADAVEDAKQRLVEVLAAVACWKRPITAELIQTWSQRFLTFPQSDLGAMLQDLGPVSDVEGTLRELGIVGKPVYKRPDYVIVDPPPIGATHVGLAFSADGVLSTLEITLGNVITLGELDRRLHVGHLTEPQVMTYARSAVRCAVSVSFDGPPGRDARVVKLVLMR